MRRAARAAASIVVAAGILLLGALVGDVCCREFVRGARRRQALPKERPLVRSEDSRTVRGDWNDVEAAAVVGLERAECASCDAPRTRRPWLPTRTPVLDQDGVLQFTRAAPADGAVPQDRGENIDITVFCRVGPFGDQEREADIGRGARPFGRTAAWSSHAVAVSVDFLLESGPWFGAVAAGAASDAPNDAEPGSPSVPSYFR